MNSNLSILITMRIEEENIKNISGKIDYEILFPLKNCFL